MSATHLAVDVLLTAAVVAQLLCCLGVLVARDAFDRLHYAGAGTTVGPILLATAIVLRHGYGSESLETIAAVGLLFLTSPVLVTATARAARRRAFGQESATADEVRHGV